MPEPSSPGLETFSQRLGSLPSSPESPARQHSPTATLRSTAPGQQPEQETPGVFEVSSKRMVGSLYVAVLVASAAI